MNLRKRRKYISLAMLSFGWTLFSGAATADLRYEPVANACTTVPGRPGSFLGMRIIHVTTDQILTTIKYLVCPSIAEFRGIDKSAEGELSKNYDFYQTHQKFVMQEQLVELKALRVAIDNLNKTNAEFKQTFDKTVAERQGAMTKLVVDKLDSIPRVIAADKELIDAITSVMSTRLSDDEEFIEKIRARP